MPFVAHNAFVMNRNFRAYLVKKFIANILAGISSGFVTERPHYNACTASVSQIHSLHSVKISGCPLRIMADKVNVIMRFTAAAVSFDIGFINNIKTVHIAKHNKLRVRGIM